MICPNCKSEFEKGILTCSDCHIPLVSELMPDLEETVETPIAYDYVLVYRPINSQEVALIKMIMEREEIPYFIKNEPLHRTVLFSIHGPGEMQLYVAEKYAEATIKLLDEEFGHS